MKLKQNFLCVPRNLLQDCSVISHLGNFSNRDTSACLHTEFQSVSPFSVVMKRCGLSQRAALVFLVLLATRLLGKHLQGSCPGRLRLLFDCCGKNLSAFSRGQTGTVLPASTSHHFCPLQPQRCHDAGGICESRRSGRTWGGHLAADLRPTLPALILTSLLYMGWVRYVPYFDCLIKTAQMGRQIGQNLPILTGRWQLRSNWEIRANKWELWHSC